MNLDDGTLNIIAIGVELGLPLMLLILCYFKKSARNFFWPLFGALTPAVAAYLFLVVGYHFIDPDEYSYSYFVVWIMSFPIYCVLILVGIIISLVLRNKLGSWINYSVGFLAGLVVGFGFAVLS